MLLFRVQVVSQCWWLGTLRELTHRRSMKMVAYTTTRTYCKQWYNITNLPSPCMAYNIMIMWCAGYIG